MADFSKEVFDAAEKEREVGLTTRGRKTGKPHQVTVWIATEGKHLYMRSGAGVGRHWPQNFIHSGEAVVVLGSKTLKVKPRHVTDPDEARAVSRLYRTKYGSSVKPSQAGEPLTPGETATFELLPG